MSMNTDYLSGYIDALKGLSARIDAVMADALAKAAEDAENPLLESFSGGQKIALLAVGQRRANTTRELCQEVMSK